MSFWTMGFNQHVRGVWANHMIYNIHLLTGKIAEPGNSPFSLTGQPSACGTAREVGTFSHRLPADMLVTNPEHRKNAEEIWKLPAGLLPDKPGYHAVQQDRMLKDGKLNAYWMQVNNNLQAAPNSDNETYAGYRNPDNFIVVSDAYPTVTGDGGRPCPACGDVGREGGRLRQRRAPHPLLAPARHGAGRGADRTFGSSWSFQSGSRPTRSGRLKFWSQNPAYRGKTLYEVLYANGSMDKFPVIGHGPGIRERRIQAFRVLRPERAVRGIRLLRAPPRSRPCRF